jgi:hypothetical protein
MITAKDFKKQIAKPFGIEMRQHGFKGTGFEYFKQTDDYLIAVYISPSRWGGSCTVGFAIHPKQVDKDSDGKIDLTKLKLYRYEFKMGTTKEARGEWWDFSDEEQTNLVTLAQILKSIKQVAFPVIERLTINSVILDAFDVTEMDKFHENWTRKTGVSIATTDLRFAWAMTLVFEKKNPDKAKQFAEWGLSQLEENDRDWFGLKDFERVLSKNNDA